MKNITNYINSGILESYALGFASPDEVKELNLVKKLYPEVDIALRDLEIDMETIAAQMAITPPPGTWEKIEASINNLTLVGQEPAIYKEFNAPETGKSPQYIEVEVVSNEMRINKAWKWVFAAVFILGKIFLGCAIYFYLENRQAQQQVQELKTELKQIKH